VDQITPALLFFSGDMASVAGVISKAVEITHVEASARSRSL
jgi:hypothetical protein